MYEKFMGDGSFVCNEAPSTAAIQDQRLHTIEGDKAIFSV
jgi:hypothetical protein